MWKGQKVLLKKNVAVNSMRIYFLDMVNIVPSLETEKELLFKMNAELTAPRTFQEAKDSVSE